MNIYKKAIALLKTERYNGLAEFIERYPCVLFKMDNEGMFLLHYAVQQSIPIRLLEAMKTLHVNFNQKNKYGETPLYLSKNVGITQVSSFLENSGAQMDDFEIIVYKLGIEDDLDNLKKLISKHKELIFLKDREGQTILHHALICYHFEFAKWLIKAGADIHSMSYLGRSIPGCCNLKKTEGVEFRKYLNSLGAVCSDIEKFVEMVIYDIDKAIPFLEDNFHILHMSHFFHGPLLNVATTFDHKELVKYLLKKEVYVNATSVFGNTALHEAESVSVARILLENGADINSLNLEGNSPLHCAADRTDNSTVIYLLKNGANIRIANHKGQTAFDVVIYNKYYGDKKIINLIKKIEARNLSDSGQFGLGADPKL